MAIRRFRLLSVWVGMLLAGSPVGAQTFSGLVHDQISTRLVDQGVSLSGGTSFLFEDRGRTSNGLEIDLAIGQDYGFLALNPEKALALVYTFDLIDVESDDPALPPRLGDVFFGLGAKLGEGEVWRTDLIGGVGYAGTRPFSESESLYGRATLMMTRSEPMGGTGLTLLLDFDGNRPYLEDAPLPGVAFTNPIGEKGFSWLGYPFGRIRFHPADQWTLDAEYDASRLQYDVRISHDLSKTWQAYAETTGRLTAAYEEDLDGDRRAFFTGYRVEAGARWRMEFSGIFEDSVPVLEITLAGGYAFGQNFDFGGDIGSAGGGVSTNDQPYFRFVIAGGF